jgi:hypothetical protein
MIGTPSAHHEDSSEFTLVETFYGTFTVDDVERTKSYQVFLHPCSTFVNGVYTSSLTPFDTTTTRFTVSLSWEAEDTAQVLLNPIKGPTGAELFVPCLEENVNLGKMVKIVGVTRKVSGTKIA